MTVGTENIAFGNFSQNLFLGDPAMRHGADVVFFITWHSMMKIKRCWMCFTTPRTAKIFLDFQQPNGPIMFLLCDSGNL